MCATLTAPQLRAEYEKLRGLKFPSDLVDGLQAEAASAITLCAGAGDVKGVVNWWGSRGDDVPSHAGATQRLALMQPPGACCERVFSRLKSHFTVQQMSSALQDYIGAAIMLDCNNRDVVAAWY